MDAMRSLSEAPPLLFSDSLPLNIHPAILSTLRSLETQLKHIWSDSRILLMEIGDRRLYLALCIAHRHLLQSILEFTLFPARIGVAEEGGGGGRGTIIKYDNGNILETEREVRKFARRIWQYLERIRCFLGDYTRFDEVDVRMLRDEAVKCTQLTVMLQLRYAERTSAIAPIQGINLGEVARGRFLLRLHESLKRRSFDRDSVFLMEEAQIRACIADVRSLLSPRSLTHPHRRPQEGGRGTGQSGLWTWLMKKTAFLNLNHSAGEDDGQWQRHVDDVLLQRSSTHSGSRESRLFGASDSSELIQQFPMAKRDGKDTVKAAGQEETTPPMGTPLEAIPTGMQPVNPIIVASQRMDFTAERERGSSPSRPAPSIDHPSINTSGIASPQVEARIVASGILNIPSPTTDHGSSSYTEMKSPVPLSPKGKSPLHSPLHSPTRAREDALPFHPLILNTFKTTTRPLNCSSSTADFIMKNSTSTVAFQFHKNPNNSDALPSPSNANSHGSGPGGQPLTTSKLIKSTSAHSLTKSPNKTNSVPPSPRSPMTPPAQPAPSTTSMNQGKQGVGSPPSILKSGFVTDYSSTSVSKFVPFNTQVSGSTAINEAEMELLTATQSSTGFRCAMCGIKLSSTSYRHLEGNRRACRKACLTGASSPTDSEGVRNNVDLEEEKALGDAITESIRKSCYT